MHRVLLVPGTVYLVLVVISKCTGIQVTICDGQAFNIDPFDRLAYSACCSTSTVHNCTVGQLYYGRTGRTRSRTTFVPDIGR
jgi:hypothetical protein